MRISVPKELKNHEDRVALTPAGVHDLAGAGHQVTVESGAGVESGFTDATYEAAGAKIVENQGALWEEAELVVKVKEPTPAEYQFLRPDLTVFAYLHLAADPELARVLMESRTTAISYETVETDSGELPLLAPMSEVAGRLGVQVGAYHLMKPVGGPGVLMGGVPGTPPAKVVVIGGGVAGTGAAMTAAGMGADVTVLDISVPRLRAIAQESNGRIRTAFSSHFEIAELVSQADLVIGSVLVPGDSAPKLVTDAMIAGMKPGSVLVDIAIDQGGCFENSHPTTHDDPVFKVHDTLFYCVGNMPGAVPRTSTIALTNVSLPYIRQIANNGPVNAARRNPEIQRGFNVFDGKVTHRGVAKALGVKLYGFQEATGTAYLDGNV